MCSVPMPYSVVIVDDEALARAGLYSLIDWNARGFEIVGEAENGEEGRKLVERLKPDLAIVDIRMPVLDGIALMEAIRTASPETRVIVLSSYDEFEYAREAMKHGAIDYLLKLEVTAEQLGSVLDRAKNRFIVRESSGVTLGAAPADLAEALMDPGQHADLKRLLGRDEDAVAWYVAVVRLSGRHLPKPVSRMFIEIVETDVDARAVETVPGVFAVIIALPATHQEPGRRKGVKDLLSRARAQVTSYVELEMTATADGPAMTVGELPDAYESAYDHLFGSKAVRAGSVQFVDDDRSPRLIGSANDEETGGLEQIAGDVENGFRIQDSAAVQRALIVAERALRGMQVVDRNAVMHLCTEIIHQVEAQSRPDQRTDELWGQPFLELGSLVSIDEFAAWIRRVREGIVRRILDAKHHPLVDAASALIRSRYREELSLEDVAIHLNTSSSYLSRLFRRELDTTFGELLTSVRLAHAKILLEDPAVSIQAVAERVGYENAYYFSRVFKRHCGATPTEYRRAKLNRR